MFPLRRRLPAALLLLLGAATQARADPADLRARAEGVRAELVRMLEDLAKWSNSSKLFGQRDETWALVLEFEPEHARARSALKFERDEAGGWVQAPGYKPPRNWTPKVLPDWERRRDEALAAYRDGMLAVLGEARDGSELGWAADGAVALLGRHPGDPAVLATLRAVLLRHLALLATSEVPVELQRVTSRLDAHFPGDPQVRAALGEVLLEGRWVLPATARSMQQRTRLAEAAASALAGVPQVKSGTLTPEEEAVGLPFSAVYESAHMRVVGTTTANSLLEIARSCEAAGPFFESVFGRPPVRPVTYTFYVFPRLAHWQQFAERFTGLSEALRPAAREATGSGFPLGTTAYACLPVGSAAAERDLCVDVIFQTLLYQTFARWHDDTKTYEDLPGWVRIGLSDYLTYRLIGTRILTTVGGEYARPLDNPKDRSPKERKGWLTAARRILDQGGAAGTRMMLGKTLGAFQSEDAVTSFAFASYLLEGLPERTTPLLDAVGGGKKATEFAAEVLGKTLEALHVDWSRWLAETAGGD